MSAGAATVIIVCYTNIAITLRSLDNVLYHGGIHGKDIQADGNGMHYTGYFWHPKCENIYVSNQSMNQIQ